MKIKNQILNCSNNQIESKVVCQVKSSGKELTYKQIKEMIKTLKSLIKKIEEWQDEYRRIF